VNPRWPPVYGEKRHPGLSDGTGVSNRGAQVAPAQDMPGAGTPPAVQSPGKFRHHIRRGS